MLLALSMIALSPAAEVEIATGIPINVLVDGVPVVWDEATGLGRSVGLLAGKHTVESRTFTGKTSAYKEIELAANERIRFEYRKKELWHVGTYTLPGPPPPPAQVLAVAAVPSTTTVVSAPGVGITITDGVDMVSVTAGGMGSTVIVTDGLNTVAVDASGPPGSSVPMPPPPAPVNYPMDSGPYNTLLSQLDAADFSDEKMSLLKSSATHNWFTCAQLAGVLDRFDHSSDKLEAVGVVRPAILDPGNSAVINDRFDFSSDAQKAQAYFQ